MPLLALIFFGGSTLFWFAIALALGVLIGSWSSIALAPSLLSIGKERKKSFNESCLGKSKTKLCINNKFYTCKEKISFVHKNFFSDRDDFIVIYAHFRS